MPSSKNYKRDYHEEYLQEDRERRKLRVMRNAARRQLEKRNKVHVGDGKDVNHITPLSKGGGNSKGNLNVVPKKRNSSYARTKTGAMKSKKSYPRG